VLFNGLVALCPLVTQSLPFRKQELLIIFNEQI
jgi:hypothetical protein